VRRPLVSPALRVALRPGGRARANGRAAAAHRLGATTGTGAAMGSVYAAGGAEDTYMRRRRPGVAVRVL
jgi:hypothetical protein